MQENHRYKVLSVLVDKAKQMGFILFDDIMDECMHFDLSIQDVDWVSNQIATMNIIVRDEMPNVESDNDDFSDFAQSDYESVYRRIVEIKPELNNYIESIKLIIPPQHREFSKLKFQILDGNPYARKRCIEMHLRIVLKIALRRYEQFGGEIEDFISDGTLGLIYAVDKYDPYSNGAFSSYASRWIMNLIQRRQPTMNPQIYFPVHVKDEFFRVYDEEKLTVDDFATPYDEICTEEWIYSLYQKGEISKDILPAFNINYSIESLMELDAENWVVQNRLLTDENLIVEEAEFYDFQLRIEKALSTLNVRESEVIKMRNGFYDNRTYSLEEIGLKFGVTRERIRQIESKALKRLRQLSKKKYYCR